MNPTSWLLPRIIEFPACRSRSSTSIGTMLLVAGIANPATNPKPRLKTYTIHRWTFPLSTASAISAVNPSRRVSETIMIRRGENRSVTAPPRSMNTARGIPPSAMTIPSTRGSRVSCSTSQGVAISAN